MPARRLPRNPSLEHLKHQAKDLRKGHTAGNPGVAQQIREFHPRFKRSRDNEIFCAELSLADAQLTIARGHGFSSWNRLKRHIEKPTLADRLNLPHHDRIEDPTFRRAVELLDAGDVAGLRECLARHPKLAQQRILFEGGNYFSNPTLLEFVAENPVRHEKLPHNIVEVAKAILDAGVEQDALNETLLLAATSRVARECHAQIPLIDLLCDRGADPASALEAAAVHSEIDSVNALLRRGARLNLPVAAALGRIEAFQGLLALAGTRDRHLALALGSQFGRVEIVGLLLDAGEDPNRFNPVGGHSHATPLHQAVLDGNLDLVRLLVAHGARLDQRDVLWNGTPADWAHHQGQTEVEDFLRALDKKCKLD